MNKFSFRTILIIISLIAGLLILPFLLSSYRVSQVSQYLVFVIAVLGLNMLSGYNGQISLGHGAFFGIGAYTTAILISHFGFNYALTIPLAGLTCMTAGFMIGFPALRLSGHYLALATFGLALALPQMLKYKGIETWTGGAQGVILQRPNAPFEMSLFGSVLDSDRWIYWITVLVSIMILIFFWSLLGGRIGRALIAIRDHPTAASTMGINLSVYKSTAFAVSAACTGMAGSLAAISTGFTAPDSFPVALSISLLVGAVIGGISTVWGAFIGGLFVQIVPEMAHELSDSAPGVIYGALLLFIVYLMPDGVMGAVNRLSFWKFKGK